jgi:hypothetical protein
MYSCWKTISFFFQVTIPPFFVESWIYSSALSVVQQCDAWAGDLKLEGPTLSSFNAGKGELLELAKNQVCAAQF